MAKPTTTAMGKLVMRHELYIESSGRVTEGNQLRRNLLELSQSLGDGVAFNQISMGDCSRADLGRGQVGALQCVTIRNVPAWSSFCKTKHISLSSHSLAGSAGSDLRGQVASYELSGGTS